MVAFVAFFGIAGVANAATYFVAVGGDDVGGTNDCLTELNPCATIQHAIDEHRLAPQPDDVISVGPGNFAQNVDSDAGADEGLTIQGTLVAGNNATTISGDGTGASTCPACIVALGASPDVDVTLQDAVVTQGPSADDDLSPILVLGGSDLDNVAVDVDDNNTFAAVELCVDPGTNITDSFLDARGTDAAGVDGCAEIDITDTRIFTSDGPALNTPGTPGETSVITRSWLGAGASSANSAAFVDEGLTLDSSIVSGGATALTLPGSGGDNLINNAVLDAGTPWLDDGESVFVGRNAEVETTVDSSILVDQVFVETNGADGTLTCDYTNFTDMSLPNAPFDNECPFFGDPGSTNTIEDPADIFESGSSSDWQLQSDAPAIDAGQPGPLFPGDSTTDFAGNPRLVPGTSATCPTGIRDQGAYEAPAVTCGPPGPTQRTLSVSTTGTGNGSVTGPGINCGGGGTACTTTVPDGTAIELSATAGDGSVFQGFAGSGCSASPCTVTMDASKSVQASFRDTRSDTRVLSVNTTGAGGGVITGPGINCGTGEGENDCTQAYALGESVELRANPDGQSIFGRFTGSGCDATPCAVTMDAPRSVVGRFDNARIPNTSFARQPQRPERNPVFRMRSSQPVPTFECRVDDGKWKECERRVVLRGLDPGRHVFRARSTNKFGVTGPAVRATFRVRR